MLLAKILKIVLTVAESSFLESRDNNICIDAGGTNPSLVEAMNLSLPILAFDCVYNRATTEEKCLYWKTSDDLRNLMKKLRHSELDSESLREKIAREMGEAGKRLYSWEKIARQYNELY